jgi:hypothetical protein
MRKHRPLLFALVGILWSASANADFTVRECIKGPGVQGKAWHLPPSSGWKNVGHLTFNHLASSDYIVRVLFDLSEGNTPGTEVEYQITLDGIPHGWYVRRVPAKYPTSQTIRSTIANVPAGQHTLGFRARNLSTTSGVRYGLFWISPLLVESTEATEFAGQCTPAAVSSSWVDVLQVSPTIPSGKMAHLDLYLETSAGTPSKNVLYRILRGGVEIERFQDSVPDVLRDGIHFAYVDKNPGSGTVNYRIQAQTIPSLTTTFGCRSVAVQSIPQVTVFEALGSNVAVPSDGSWHDLAFSPWTFPSSSSLGSVASDGWGFAHVTYDGAFNNEALLQFDLESLNGGWAFEVGVRWLHGSNTARELEALPSDWEQLGLQSSHQYRVVLKARGLCTTSQNMNFSRLRFQVLAIPDDNGFVNPGTCADAPWACCDRFPSQCTVYTCEASGELSLVSIPGLNCPF